MRKCAFFWVVIAILAFQAGMLINAQAADVVGRLTQVEGRVDILRGGELPAIPVKVDDGVQTGDVLRTKSLSKAQITFIDNSTLTIAPESRVAIEAYMFDSAQNKRNAVVQLFQGLAHVVVNKVFKSAEPDFVVKTQTAIMGVRGTEFGIRLQPNSSEVLNFEGLLQVGNIFPEVSQLFRKAFKVAYSFGSESGGGHHWVFLKGMQGTSVGRGLPPTLPFTLSQEDRKAFMHQMAGDFLSRRGGGDTGGGEGGATTTTGATTSYAGFTGQQGSDTSGGNLGQLFAYFFQTVLTNSTFYTPPTDQQPLETPPPNPGSPNPPTPVTPPAPPTYNFTLATYGGFLQSAAASPVLITSTGLGVLQGDWGDALPSLYTATDSSTFAPTSGTFPNRKVGVYTTNLVGTVSGALGSTLSGTATLNSSYVSFRYKLSNNITLDVTIDPSGRISYSYTGGSFDGVVNSSAISGTSSGNGTASPVISLISNASTLGASATMMATAASTTSTSLTAINQLSATTSTVGAYQRAGFQRGFLSHQAHGGKFRERPIPGNLKGGGPGSPINNFALTNPITKPTAPPAQHILGVGSMLGGVARTPGGRHARTARVVHPQPGSPPAALNPQVLPGTATVNLTPGRQATPVLPMANPAIPRGSSPAPPGMVTLTPKLGGAVPGK